MEDQDSSNQSTLFTVRIWHYPKEQSSLRWRGKVQDVSSGAWRYFHNWESLLAFLQRQTACVQAEVIEE